MRRRLGSGLGFGHLRRSAAGQRTPSSRQHPDVLLQHNGLILNYRTRTVAIGEDNLGLTRSEFDLLHTAAPGRRGRVYAVGPGPGGAR